jgi:hypothetical protein
MQNKTAVVAGAEITTSPRLHARRKFQLTAKNENSLKKSIGGQFTAMTC